jgi:lysozyme
MQINPAGLSLIKQYEGFSKTPYRCPAGLWTIGYGHTAGVHEHTAAITEAEALELLRRDVRTAEQAVHELLAVEVNENQFSALVSFTFNVGRANLAHSTLLARVNAEEFDAAANQFLRWVYAGGVPLQGLKNRRMAERQLFLENVT